MLKLDNEHTLVLPLVESKDDEICLLAINLLLTYWGEYNLIQEAKERARKYKDIKGSIFIEGFELAESRGYVVNIFRGNIQGKRKR